MIVVILLVDDAENSDFKIFQKNLELSFKCFCYCLLQFYHLLISMRWLLLNFKREFDYMEAIRLFEITSSRHLEVSSVEAELERGRERAKDFVKDSKFFHF